MEDKPLDKYEVIYQKGKVNKWVRNAFEKDLIREKSFKKDFFLASEGDTIADIDFRIKLFAKKQSYSTETHCRCRSLLTERIKLKTWRDED